MLERRAGFHHRDDFRSLTLGAGVPQLGPPGWDLAVKQVVVEVGSGLTGKRRKLRRILSDPDAKVVVVKHRDRLARFGVEHLEAALSAQGRRIVVADSGETTDDLVRDVIEVLTSMCARLYGRRGARNRAMRALTATKRGPGEAA